MMKKTSYTILCFITFVTLNLNSKAQQLILPQGYPQVNIDISNGASEGYFFWGPMPISGNTPGYLIIMDNYGTPVYYKQTQTKTYCFQPYPTGNLAYFDGSIGKYVSIDSSYQAVDTMGCVGCDRFDLHELKILKNGHYLLSGFKYRIVDMSVVVPGGNPAATIINYLIQEFDANDQLVFNWNTADHYAITDADDHVDLTTSSIDPTSFCSIDVDTDTTLIFSMAIQNEITRVDRRTGEVIWRMGGKNNQFTFVNNTRPFTRQHDVSRLPNGNITMFDAGAYSSPNYARAVEYKIDEQNKIATQVWEYDHGKTIHSIHKGSVQRLPDGNTLIGWAGYGGSNPPAPAATEIRSDGTIAFEMTTPLNDDSYRVLKFPWKTNLFVPLTDSINYGNWNGYTESVYLLMVRNNSDNPVSITSAALHSSYFYVDEQFPVVIPAKGQSFLKVIFYPIGVAQNTRLNDILTLNSDDVQKKQRIAIQVHLRGFVPDRTSPSVSFIPDENFLNQGDVIKILFSEPVRNPDNSEINDLNVSSLLTFRKDDINGQDITFNASINPEKTEITLTPSADLILEHNYFILINSVEDTSGNSTPTTSRIYTVQGTTFSVFPDNPATWKIYPNPVKDKLYIMNDGGLNYRLDLYNIVGELFISKEVMQPIMEIDLSGIPEGIYFLKITSRNVGSIKTRIVVKSDN